jgi:hypothetical protein
MTSCSRRKKNKKRRMKMTTNSDKPSQSMDDELVAKLKYLRLGRLLSHWDETLEMARKGRYSAGRLLKHVLEEEYRAKRENARDRKSVV